MSTEILPVMIWLEYIAQGSHTDGLSCTASAATTAGLDTVLFQVGEVSMAGSRVHVHGAVSIVLGPLVFVPHHHAYWRAQGDTELGSRLYLDPVLFVSRGCQSTLSGSPPCHLGLDVCLCELHAGRAPVDDAADRAAV